jgi:hypothetical protein
VITMNQQRSFFVRNWPGFCLKCSSYASAVETCATFCTNAQVVIIFPPHFHQDGSFPITELFSFFCVLLCFSAIFVHCFPLLFCVLSLASPPPHPGFSNVNLFTIFIFKLSKESSFNMCRYRHTLNVTT